MTNPKQDNGTDELDGTKPRAIRVSDSEWERFERAAARASEVLHVPLSVQGWMLRAARRDAEALLDGATVS